MIGPYGIGTYLSHLLPLLEKADYRFRILHAPSYIPPKEKPSHVEYFPLNAPIYSIREQVALLRKIPPCDLFWSPHYNIPLGPIRAKKRIVTLHDAYPLAHRLSLLKKGYAQLAMRAAVHLSDAIITNSHFSQTEIIRWTGAKAK
ncbi:MAG: glycosyltransferase, partial [Bacteroidetes bacterium]|nr:glycosyltransferase [Bacteroidota bacterium]